MQQKRTHFPSKVILFGEYLVLFGGDALAIPFETFSMQITHQPQVDFKNVLSDFSNYLLSHSLFENRIDKSFLASFFETNSLESKIPMGYGLGSSGAVVACFYEIFIRDKKESLVEIQQELASMEAFFHEKSSGLDPLTSYIQEPILIQKQIPKKISLQRDVLSPFWLFDSGIERKAHVAIHIFKELMTQDSFQKVIKEKMLPINQSIIQKMIEGTDIQHEIKELSQLQFELFEALIPASVKEIWQKGLETNRYYMKLCGAGKGGFFLIYSNEKEAVKGSLRLL
jgi:mevalonate kinase